MREGFWEQRASNLNAVVASTDEYLPTGHVAPSAEASIYRYDARLVVWKSIACIRWLSMCPLYHVLIWLLVALAAGVGHAQNLVLQLDGEGDYVQLPGDLFSDLDEATVEAWIKWEVFGTFSQPWGFGSGQTRNVMALNNVFSFNTLQFFIYEAGKLQIIRLPGVLRRGKWCHIAAVSGHTGMRLYLNGVLIGQHEYSGSFSAILPGGGNYLGKAHWPMNSDFQGQLDEIRIWDRVRTAEEIQAYMFERLTGKEPHLVALWNLDSGDAADATRHGYDGILKGDAQCVEAYLPLAGELARPSVLSGRITRRF